MPSVPLMPSISVNLTIEIWSVQLIKHQALECSKQNISVSSTSEAVLSVTLTYETNTHLCTQYQV